MRTQHYFLGKNNIKVALPVNQWGFEEPSCFKKNCRPTVTSLYNCGLFCCFDARMLKFIFQKLIKDVKESDNWSGKRNWGGIVPNGELGNWGAGQAGNSQFDDFHQTSPRGATLGSLGGEAARKDLSN